MTRQPPPTARRRRLAVHEREALQLAVEIIDHLPAVMAGTRAARRLSQDVAAGQLRVDRQQISRWENGKNTPTGPYLVRVLRWLAADPGAVR